VQITNLNLHNIKIAGAETLQVSKNSK